MQTRAGSLELKTLVDIGAGHCKAVFAGYRTITIDGRPDYQPDIISDLRHLPLESESVDAIYASHVLEHFGFFEVESVFSEWLRILKPGGEVLIRVPNIEWACREILAGRYSNIAQAILYGEQSYDFNFHKCGFSLDLFRDFMGKFDLTGRIGKTDQELFFEGTKYKGDEDGRKVRT